MTCHNHATYMLIWPTAYLTHMPHCVSLSHTSYASGMNISSHPPLAGYLDILDFSLYPESYESWVIVSHISHNESWWVIWLIWVMLRPLVSMLPPHMCRHIGYSVCEEKGRKKGRRNCIYRPACCAAGKNWNLFWLRKRCTSSLNAQHKILYCLEPLWEGKIFYIEDSTQISKGQSFSGMLEKRYTYILPVCFATRR